MGARHRPAADSVAEAVRTVEPVPIEIEVPPGFWNADASHLPLPRTPMTDSAFDEGAAFADACARFGLLVQPVFATIGGWFYLSIQPVGGRLDASTPPAWLMPLLVRLSAASRRRLRRSKQAAAEDYPTQVIDRWYDEQLPDLEARIAALRDTELTTLDGPALVRHLRTARELTAHGLRVHFRLNIASWLGIAELGLFCQERLGWHGRKTDSLLTGLSIRSTEPARELAALVDADEDSPEFVEYLRVYGCRAVTLELADRTVGEIPGLTQRLLCDQVAQGYDPASTTAALAAKREQLAAEAHQALDAAGRARFDRVLARAARAYPVREDNVFFTSDAPVAVLRYGLLEAGERLASRGVLDNAADVFFCTFDEVLAALPNPGARHQDLVLHRKGRHRWALENPGPHSYGKDPGPPPSARWLPRHARVSLASILWMLDRALATEDSNRHAPPRPVKLTGVAASAGQYRGTVRVIRSEAEFGKLRAGDVLVCPCTRPSWSVLFPSVGAVVTDVGGSLSHPAIIAREHRIPAVVATGFATKVLRDGQTVLVDGTAGTVEIEHSGETS